MSQIGNLLEIKKIMESYDLFLVTYKYMKAVGNLFRGKRIKSTSIGKTYFLNIDSITQS